MASCRCDIWGFIIPASLLNVIVEIASSFLSVLLATDLVLGQPGLIVYCTPRKVNVLVEMELMIWICSAVVMVTKFFTSSSDTSLS